jgi:NADPH2:quinone reductase
MRAIQIVELSGPESALKLVDIPEPGRRRRRDRRPRRRRLLPEVLQTRGPYQLKPDLPFVPGSEVAGVVRSAPTARVRGGRPRRRVLHARRLRRGRRRAAHFTFSCPTRSTSRRAPG